jgi:hypothetical protein
MDKLLYTIPEFGTLIGRNKSSAYQLVKDGAVETVLLGGQKMVPVEAAKAFVARLAASTTVERILELVDEEGRLDVAALPPEATLADLREARRRLAESTTRDVA